MPFLDYSRLGQFIKTRKKEEVRFNCIFCDDETYHLYVNLSKRVYHCFKCGSKGKTNVNPGVVQSTHLEYVPAKKSEENKRSYFHKLPKPVYDLLTPAATRYLINRGIKESDISRHKIYAAHPSSIYFGRLIIPCNTFRGFADYYVARAYTKLLFPKYLNPISNKGLFISPPLQDEYHDQLWADDEVVIVEGPFDYLKASRHGPCVALLGKTLSLEAARGIVSRFNKAYVLLDRGLKEKQAGLHIRDILNIHIDIEILDLKDHKDPGEMEPHNFASLFK